MLWPLEVHPVMPVHWSASAMIEMQMRDGGRAGSVERPDTEVPWGPQPLPAMGAIMARLLCVTVVVILALGSLWRSLAVFFPMYGCLWKERGSLSCVNTVDGEIMGGLGPDTNRPPYLLSLLQSSLEAAWEMGERETRLSKP